MQRRVCVVNVTTGDSFDYKEKLPFQFTCLNISPSVSWRLVRSWLFLTVGERRLLVAWRAAAAGVWGGVVIGGVSILLVKLTDPLAISPKGEKGQERLLR